MRRANAGVSNAKPFEVPSWGPTKVDLQDVSLPSSRGPLMTVSFDTPELRDNSIEEGS